MKLLHNGLNRSGTQFMCRVRPHKNFFERLGRSSIRFAIKNAIVKSEHMFRKGNAAGLAQTIEAQFRKQSFA